MPRPLRAAPRGVRRAPLLASLLLLGACGGGGGDGTGVVPVASVQVTPSSASLYLGATLQLTARTLDASGNLLTGRAVTYTSANPAIAPVSAAGIVSAAAVGTTAIQVASGGQTASVAVTVVPVPVASVVTTPPAATIAVSATTQLTAIVRDSANGALSGRTITWTSSAPAVATVSVTGLVTGVAAGTAAIRATAEGKFGESTITVASGNPPTITSVSPALLSPGITATITGTNFGTGATPNAVSIDGVAAQVTAATATQLTVTVPLLPCRPAHTGAVVVSTLGLSASATQPVRAGTAVALTTGTPVILTAAQAACADLPAGAGQYVASVVDLEQLPTSVTAFSLSGGGAASGAAPSPVVRTLMPAATPTARVLPTTLDGVFGAATRDRAERLHASILAGNVATLQRFRAAGRLPQRGRGAASRSLVPGARSAVVLPAVGDTRAFRVQQFTTALDAQFSCNNFVDITARAVYVGTHGIVYEDVAAPLAKTMDSYYRDLGAEFDNSMYVVDSTYFGDPLANDRSTDADGHFNMVFTPKITTGVAGFVTGCDFSPRNTTDDKGSNFGENFYAIVPTKAGTGFQSGDTPDSWRRGIRSVLVHEVKHLSSFEARITNNASVFEESWLEEGTARHAEELWARTYIYKAAWKGNASYRSTIYCDVRPSTTTTAECYDRPFSVFGHFSTLYDVLANSGAASMFGRVADGDFKFYAMSWSLVRYAMDRYASTEAGFLRGITQATTSAGLASLSSLTGQSASTLLGNWSLTMYLDDRTPNPDLNYPTWNTHDIYAGMNRDFASQNFFLSPFPLVPTSVGSASFSSVNGGIHGGSFAMFLVPSSATAGSSIGLRDASGAAPASAVFNLALVRVP